MALGKLGGNEDVALPAFVKTLLRTAVVDFSLDHKCLVTSLQILLRITNMQLLNLSGARQLMVSRACALFHSKSSTGPIFLGVKPKISVLRIGAPGRSRSACYKCMAATVQAATCAAEFTTQPAW